MQLTEWLDLHVSSPNNIEFFVEHYETTVDYSTMKISLDRFDDLEITIDLKSTIEATIELSVIITFTD